MLVKELIVELLEYPLDATVEFHIKSNGKTDIELPVEGVNIDSVINGRYVILS